MDKEDLICRYDAGNPCEGKVTEQTIVEKEACFPICEGHYDLHTKIMILYHKGFNLDAIVDMHIEDINKEANVIILTGFDLKDMKI